MNSLLEGLLIVGGSTLLAVGGVLLARRSVEPESLRANHDVADRLPPRRGVQGGGGFQGVIGGRTFPRFWQVRRSGEGDAHTATVLGDAGNREISLKIKVVNSGRCLNRSSIHSVG